MSLECAKHQASFSALIDKQLELPEQGALEEHLCHCLPCSAQFAEQNALEASLSQYFVRAQEAVPDLWPELESKLPDACQLVIVELSAFLDGELSSAAQEGVRVHLKDCQSCLLHFRDLNTTNRLIVKALELPAETKLDLWPKLRAQLNENCTLIESELSAFIDQEMPMQRHRDITVHILECPTCSETVRRFSGVGQLITAGYLPVLPENFNIGSKVSGQLKVVPFIPKEKPKAKLNISIIAVAVVTSALVAGSVVALVLNLASRETLISSEEVLLHSCFARPYDTAEALVYGQ